MSSIFWAVLALFLFGALLRQDWVYYLAYVLAGVWLFSTWSVRRRLSLLEVRREFLDRAFPGQHIVVRLRLRNRSRLPVTWLAVEERVPLELKDLADYRIVLNVAGRGIVEHTYSLFARQRGYYALGPLALRTGDLFGFAESRWEESEVRHVTVFPQVVPLARLELPSRIPQGVQSTSHRLFEDPARLVGVRNYAPGDSRRRIHWKASAHANELLVKKYQPAIGLSSMVVLNMDRNAYTGRYTAAVSEWAVTIAASIASAVSEARQPVGLLCNAVDAASGGPPLTLPPRPGAAQLTSVLSTLARAQLRTEGAALSDFLAVPLASLEWGTTVVVVTPHVSEELLWVLHQAYRRGATPMLILCAEQVDARLLAGRAQRLGIQFHQTLWDRDLQSLQALAQPAVEV